MNDREYVHRDLLPFLFTADCEPRDLTETPVAGDESWHIETVAKRDANKKALEQVEKATDSEPVKGKELLESDELKRKLSEAEERFRSGVVAEEGEVRVTLAFRKASRWRRPEKGQRREGNEPHAVLSEKKDNASPVEALVLHSSKRSTSERSPVRPRQ